MHYAWRLAAGAVLALAAWTGQAAAADQVVLKLHHFLAAGSVAQQKFFEPWAKKLAEESGGRLKVEIYPAMQLGGKPPQLYDQVKDGIADIVWTLPGYTAGRFPISEVFELPFMPSTAEATSQALQEFAEKHLMGEFKDVHPILFHCYRSGLFHTRKAVRTIEDVKGLKIRTPTRTITDAAKALGAIPVAMPAPEVPEALSKGVVDGVAFPWEVAIPMRLHEVVKYHTQFGDDPGFFTAVFLFAMNKAKYDSLSADLKKVIDDNSGLKIAKWVGQAWDQAEVDGAAKAMTVSGTEIITIPPAELAKWKTATEKVDDAWVAAMAAKGVDGKALLADAKALIAKYKAMGGKGS